MGVQNHSVDKGITKEERMAGPFLHLDINAGGIHARILEGSSSREKKLDKLDLAYEDLPEALSPKTPFQAGLDLIATRLDLSSCSEAIVMISSLTVSFRNISTPFTNDKKIRQILPLELAPHLPLPEEPYVSDFFIQEAQFVSDQQLILSASILESDIRQLVADLKLLHITPVVVTPKGLAAAACFLSLQKSTNFLLIHMDTHEIGLTLIANGKIVAARSIGTGSIATEPPGANSPGARNFSIQKLAQIATQTILGFRQRSESTAVFDIFILSPEQPGIAAQIRSALGESLPPQPDLPGSQICVEEIETPPLARISPDRQPDHLFNFCKGEFGSVSFFQTHKTGLVTLFFLALMLFASAVFSIHQEISILENQITMERQAALSIYQKTFPKKKPGQRAAQAPLMLMQASVKHALKSNTPPTPDGENTPDIQALEVLFELSNLPKTIDIDISRLLLDNGRLVISGSTDNYNTIDKIKGLWGSSYLFKQVDIGQAKADKTNNRVLFKFIITYL
jgi:general secretion pathway protein L